MTVGPCITVSEARRLLEEARRYQWSPSIQMVRLQFHIMISVNEQLITMLQEPEEGHDVKEKVQ